MEGMECISATKGKKNPQKPMMIQILYFGKNKEAS